MGWNNDISIVGGYSPNATSPTMGYLNNGSLQAGPITNAPTPAEIGMQKANEAWNNTRQTYLDYVNYTMGAGGAMADIYAGYRYTERLWGGGYFRTAKGYLHSLDILNPQANGKFVQGVQGYRNSANLAKSTTQWARNLGTATSVLTTTYSAYQFVKNPNFSNGLDLGVGIVGIAFWEVGVAYGAGKTAFEGMMHTYSTLPEKYKYQDYYQSQWLNQYYPSYIGW